MKRLKRRVSRLESSTLGLNTRNLTVCPATRCETAGCPRRTARRCCGTFRELLRAHAKCDSSQPGPGRHLPTHESYAGDGSRVARGGRFSPLRGPYRSPALLERSAKTEPLKRAIAPTKSFHASGSPSWILGSRSPCQRSAVPSGISNRWKEIDRSVDHGDLRLYMSTRMLFVTCVFVFGQNADPRPASRAGSAGTAPRRDFARGRFKRRV
jgi:hypothetical protein